MKIHESKRKKSSYEFQHIELYGNLFVCSFVIVFCSKTIMYNKKEIIMINSTEAEVEFYFFCQTFGSRQR